MTASPERPFMADHSFPRAPESSLDTCRRARKSPKSCRTCVQQSSKSCRGSRDYPNTGHNLAALGNNLADVGKVCPKPPQRLVLWSRIAGLFAIGPCRYVERRRAPSLPKVRLHLRQRQQLLVGCKEVVLLVRGQRKPCECPGIELFLEPYTGRPEFCLFLF